MGTGSKIKALLKQQKKTIKQLSQESGISINTLYSITKRDSNAVTFPILEKIAFALSVPIEELLPDSIRDKALSEADGLTKFFEEEYNNPNSDHYHSDKIQKFLSRESNLKFAIEDAVTAMPFDQEDNAQSQSDAIFVSAMEGLSNSYIKQRIIEVFNLLNRRGKIEALIRIQELEDNSRFHDSPDSFSDQNDETD